MAKSKKAAAPSAKLTRLRNLEGEPATAAVVTELRHYLADTSNVIVAEAAKLIRDRSAAELARDLVAAFDRFMIGPEEIDKQCRAKIEIIDALNRLDHAEPEVFLRGLTHVQDSRFGEQSQDAAGALRAYCAFGLVRIGHPGVVLLLTELLHDSDNTARAGAARALGGTGSLAAVPLLRYKVREGDAVAEVIGECFASLFALSFEESLPFVAGYLRSFDSQLQETAVFALAETRRPEALAILRDFWPRAAGEVRETLLVALAMFRLPAANEFLIGLIADRHASAVGALSALAIYRENPKIRASIAAAVEANGTRLVLEMFRKKFPEEC